MLRSPGQAEALISVCWIISVGVNACQEVIFQNPWSIEEVQNIVENVAAALEEDAIPSAEGNVLWRCSMLWS